MTDQCRLILTFLQLPGIGRKTVYRYMLPSPTDRYDESSIDQLLTIARTKSTRVKEFNRGEIIAAMSAADHIYEDCEQLDVEVIAVTDPNFPARLLQIDDPPVILFYRGNIESLNEQHTIAIIGTREPTEYGYRIAVRLGEMMAEAGIVTVSGLALGCDTGGHTGTINKNGTTVALLANGLDTIYPKENQLLASELLDLGGCLISEYAPHAEIQRGFFVDRDRLQAGLSDAVFVVETDIKGGTMHTVGFAQKYKKTVYCFNHPASLLNEPKTRGNQDLISKGNAQPIYTKEHIQKLISTIKDIPLANNRPIQIEQISFWNGENDG